MAEYDYIIVGAGSAGCVLAGRLTEDPDIKVLLLESGVRDKHPFLRMPLAWRLIWRGPRFNWNYRSEREPYLDNREIVLPRGKVLGGSSSINGMLYMRGHPRDYDIWRQVGCEGWSYADVLPYFKRAEGSWRGEGTYHGGSGPLAVSATVTKNVGWDYLSESVRAAGMPVSDDIAGSQAEGFSIADLTIKDGKRASAARMYLYPALARPNLRALTGAQTRRVVVENGRAIGVDYVKDGEAVTARATREVILSGGTYNSPQILMLSGIGPADEIRKHGITPVHDLPGVGKNLQEHPIAYVQFDLRDPVSYLTRLRFDRLAIASIQWALAGKGDAASQALSAIGFMRTRPELDRPDIQVFCNPVRLDAEVWFPVIKPSQGHRLEGHASLLHPESRGEVTLRSADHSAPPRIQLNMLSTETDRRSMRDGLRLIRHLYASGPLGKMITKEATPGAEINSDADLDAHIRRVCDVGHHPVGTCAMGQDGRSVVDPTLKVRGLEGLRVVDASVMPLVPGGNTNAPTIMIAEKAVDMIRGRPALAPAEL